MIGWLFLWFIIGLIVGGSVIFKLLVRGMYKLMEENLNEEEQLVFMVLVDKMLEGSDE